MKEVKFYRQCTLMRVLPDSTQHTTTWLPECFCEVGMVLKLKNIKTGEWVDGWKVMSASPPMDAKTVETNARDYLHQRSASDVIFSEIKKENDRASARL